MINWLKHNKKFLSIRAIEHQINMPDSTLIKAVNGVQNLPKKWEQPLQTFLIGFANTSDTYTNKQIKND